MPNYHSLQSWPHVTKASGSSAAVSPAIAVKTLSISSSVSSSMSSESSALSTASFTISSMTPACNNLKVSVEKFSQTNNRA
nr:hypothetical protein Itr_chr07CG05530 [Ipomoea trifida]